jgi:uncharacterized protein YqeY
VFKLKKRKYTIYNQNELTNMSDTNNPEVEIVPDFTPETASEVAPTKDITLTKEQVEKVFDTQVSVKVSLLHQLSQIIDVCNKRAAFKSEELEGVGKLYKALNGAVEDVSKQVLKAEADEAESPTPLESVAE